MIARNYRKYPDALERQLSLQFGGCVVVRRYRERHIAGEGVKRHRLEVTSRDIDPEEIPVGSIVRTPTGKEAKVLGYRGKRRDHLVRLWCQYLQPENKRFDKVLLAPKLVVVVKIGGK